MKKVILFSFLLICGLVGSQFLGGFASTWINLLTMFSLSFIMIHVGYEFEIDKSRPMSYAWDYAVAGTAAAFPWIFCILYFLFVMAPLESLSATSVKESALLARFSSPTSAGVLFSMLAAAGLSATWVFKKARVLAIFDDLDTILLMIPLKIALVGFKWQLLALVVVIVLLLALAWRYLHQFKLPISFPFVMLYAALITIACEAIHLASLAIEKAAPVHLEVLLPAFVLGCVLARPAGANPHSDDAKEGHLEGPESPSEQRVATIVSSVFMVLVGLSMPSIFSSLPTSATGKIVPADLPWGMIALHVAIITLLSNLGKMFPLFCYRREATLRERLALSIAMFPRGEVGAGVLVISLSYGIGGPALTVSVLSLALNLLMTGLFIVAVKRLLAKDAARSTP